MNNTQAYQRTGNREEATFGLAGELEALRRHNSHSSSCPEETVQS